MLIGYLQLDTVQGGKLDNDLMLEVVNFYFFKCRRHAWSIWAHLGKVDKRRANDGLVIQIYRYVTMHGNDHLVNHMHT